LGLEDAPAIALVNGATLLECNLAPPESCSAERLTGRWLAYLTGAQNPQHALSPRTVIGAFAGSQLVGYGAGHLSTRYGTEGEVQSLYVRLAQQRMGIGSELLRQLAAWFHLHGARKICVGIDADNPYAGFYTKLGATHINPHWLVWDRL
jgi:GNAT superfamily N-acetyltransferase